MDRYIADLRTDLKLSETPLKGEQKMQVMMAGTAYTTARDRLYQKLGKSFHENDFACDADPQRLHSNLLQEVPSGCATSYMVIRSLMNSIRMHAIESLDKPGAPRLGEGQGR